jgi:fumarate reductase flavoprotein subunit
MAAYLQNASSWAPDPGAVQEAIARCERPFGQRLGNLETVRERLYDVMWEKVGIIRDARSLAQAAAELADLDASLDRQGIGTSERAFNLTWHDWLNLKSLVAVSRIICAAAAAREDSRGAHYREDYPETGPLESSAYTSIAADAKVMMKPVVFTRVRPGESLLKNAA